MPYSRRKFIKLTSSVALLLSSIDTIASTIKPALKVNKKFELKILATNWGFKGTLDEYMAKVKNNGYDGVEIWWPMEQKGQDELFSLLKNYNLDVGFLCGAYQNNFHEHLEFFKKMIDAAATNKIQKPLYINCHSGKDYFSIKENEAFIAHTTRLTKQTGIKICHETHRSRMLFAAPVAKQYIKKHPELRITFDVSHWCNVSESLLQDQQETVNLTLERTDHIHARIGHQQGPQVNDPQAPEWEEAVNAHLTWWDKIAENKMQRGETLTILTEFGPPDYMPTKPYTREALSDQWTINVYMMELLRKRYVQD